MGKDEKYTIPKGHTVTAGVEEAIQLLGPWDKKYNINEKKLEGYCEWVMFWDEIECLERRLSKAMIKSSMKNIELCEKTLDKIIYMAKNMKVFVSNLNE